MNNPIEIDGSSQFFRDLENKDGHTVNKGLYNLMISKRDLMLYSKGIKPHRFWKITDVKKYFGLKGNKNDLLKKITMLHKVIMEEREKEIVNNRIAKEKENAVS